MRFDADTWKAYPPGPDKDLQGLLMPFTIRPHRRVPVCCRVTYQCGLFEGYGTVWNFFLTGWQLSGGLPLRIGEVCSLAASVTTMVTASDLFLCLRLRMELGRSFVRLIDRHDHGQPSRYVAIREYAGLQTVFHVETDVVGRCGLN